VDGCANDLASAQKATSAAYATIEPVIEGVQQTIDQVRAKAEAAEQATNAETQLRMKIAILANPRRRCRSRAHDRPRRIKAAHRNDPSNAGTRGKSIRCDRSGSRPR